MKFIVETSARHVHVTEETFKKLFGEDAKLTFKKALSQPGQFACEERITVVGPKKELANVSILGPFRKQDQIELSFTDARSIGVQGVVRESGDVANTPGCTLIGPKGSVELNVEIRLKDDNTDFINEVSTIDGVDSAVLVSYNGDYMG